MKGIIKIINKSKDNYRYIALSLFIINTMGVFTGYNPVLLLVFTCLHFLSFILYKDLVEEDDKEWALRLIKVHYFLFPLILMKTLINSFHRKSMIMTGVSLKPMILMFTIFLYILEISFIAKEENRENLKTIYDRKYFKGLAGPKELKPGDVKVCIDEDTDEDVIIPLEDRMLHMLVLGPTGCGKTSQVLFPMINQDLENDDFGMTVIEPKGDLAEEVSALARLKGRDVLYFNPTHPDCPYFNPLFGDEDEVIENIVTVYRMLGSSAGGGSSQFFQDKNEDLTRKSLKVIKRLYKDKATLINLSTLVHNSNGQGRQMVQEFARLETSSPEEYKENSEIADWFINEYFGNEKEFQHYSGFRAQVSKTVSNSYLRRVLNPPNGENDLDFDKILADGGLLAITTSQDVLRDLSSYLGYFIILNFQSAVFRRPSPTITPRRPHFLYIDEFQKYSNPGFSDMLTQGRSYVVSCTMATQARDQMAMGGGSDGEKFVKLVSTNARNVILFPGISASDAEYYSRELGEVEEKVLSKSESTPKFSLFGAGSSNGSESVSERTEVTARFSPSDIIYKEFGKVTYKVIQDKTLQAPGNGIVEWIPYELKLKVDEEVRQFELLQREKAKLIDSNKKEVKEEKDSVEDIVFNEEDKENAIEDFSYSDDTDIIIDTDIIEDDIF